MQIEQFDTGLKNQNNFQELKISAEENKQNKQIVRNYLNNTYKLGPSNIEENLSKYFSEDVNIKCFFPLNEFKGLSNFRDKFWTPLFDAFPDLERREQLVIGGAFRDKFQVGTISTLSEFLKRNGLM